MGLVNGYFVHLPISKAVEKKKMVNVRDAKFQAFLDSSGMDVDLVSSTFKWDKYKASERFREGIKKAALERKKQS